MRISVITSNNTCNCSFKAQYPTKSVLELITGYSLNQKTNAWSLGKELTGIEYGSDEYMSLLPEDPNYYAGLYAYLSTCSKHIIAQQPKLKQADDSFDPLLHLQEDGKKKMNNWFNEQIQKIGKTIEINPFKLKKKEILKEYNACVEVCNKL